ncbi:MAG: hypothetical protein FWD57_13620 [Polyangiaceae bacterium]|nr:hypothetical protein [Polyangiaceae bacterium]
MLNQAGVAGGQKQTQLHERFGQLLHAIESAPQYSNMPKRAVEVTGVGGFACLVMGIAFLQGVMAVIVSVLGGLVLLAAFLVSKKTHRRALSTKIDMYERGIVCSQGKNERQLLWNEVVDISCRVTPDPSNSTSNTDVLALIFETAIPPPLLIIVGGKYMDKQAAEKMLESLSEVWLGVWCRRARMLAQSGGMRVRNAVGQCDGGTRGDITFGWESITGVVVRGGVDHLQTGDREVSVGGIMYPSAAKRIAAIAAAPPGPPLLPAIPSALSPALLLP